MWVLRLSALTVMTIAIAGIYQNFLASLNPVVLFRCISRMPKEYALVTLFVYVTLAISFAIRTGVMQIPVIGVFLAPAVAFYSWAVIASRLGFMFYYNKHRLGL